MKRVACLFALCIVFAEVSSAASCSAGTLQNYIALGAAGCTIGNNTFFDFQDLSGSAGATELNGSSVSITPSGGNFNPAISAAVNVTARAGDTFETMFTYRVSGPTYLGETVTLSGSSETNDGGVSDIQNFCEGGIFGPDGVTGCTGVTGTLVTVDGVQNQASTTFDPFHFVSLTDDLTLSGGTFGTASGGTITDRLTAAPEPAALFITILGLVVVIASRSRARAAIRSRVTGGNL